MFIRVKLLNGLPEPLWYSVPQHLVHSSLSGLIVQVPVRNRIIPALVMDEHTTKPHNLAFELKDIQGIEPLPADEHYLSFLQKLSVYYQIEPLFFIKRIHQFLINKKDNEFVSFDKLRTSGELEKAYSTHSTVTLTDEQQKVCDYFSTYC